MINEKTVLVTGASGEIGRNLCRRLASNGYNLVLAGRDFQKLTSLETDLDEHYPRQSFTKILFDSSNLDDVKSEFSLLRKRINFLSGVVLMPPQVASTKDCLPEPTEWKRIIEESFIGPLEVLREAFKFFEPEKRSKVVIVSGISSAQVLSHYATSNVLRLMWLAEAKTLAHALGPKKIHVNTISFGGIYTEKYLRKMEDSFNTSNAIDDSLENFLAKDVENVPLRKYADLDEASSAIEGLLSSFSDHITGSNILCDGGFTRSY